MSDTSYFNEEQQGEMRYLASLKPKDRCWCGWFRAGECDTPNPCAPEHTMADRLEATCECGNYPHKPGGRMTHRRGCLAATQAGSTSSTPVGEGDKL